MTDNSYDAVNARKNSIMMQSMGLDYSQFSQGVYAFDYEALMNYTGYSIDEIRKIQLARKVGNTPLFELSNITRLVRSISPKGKGARIFVKDEAANASGSFKARRASMAVHEAAKKGYKGVIAATSGNYGAAVASQAAQMGLKCIIVQEIFDSSGDGQPEIVEKARKCEALGAEVIQLSVGPELFYTLLLLLEETGYFNASLYTPYGIAGVETLGWEIGEQCQKLINRAPDAVLITHAGGGNLTGTARGLQKFGCNNTRIIGVSVDLTGLHMASDKDFNRKSFTTGHTGFGVPFATWPDRVDVPKNAARALRYMDEYYTVTQGEVFYTTELLAGLEGMERGPAGNTSLCGAISLASQMDEDQVIVVQETEYTGAGKHPWAQLNFARQRGVEIKVGDPSLSVPGKNVIIPDFVDKIKAVKLDMEKLKISYLKNISKNYDLSQFKDIDYKFVSQDIRMEYNRVIQFLKSL
jgi:cysteine synthase